MQTKKTLKKCAIATIVAGSFMAPVHAQNTISPGFDGFVSGALDLSRTKVEDEKSSGSGPVARASIAYTSPSGFGAQLDHVYSGGSKFDLLDGLKSKASTTDTAAHLFYRNNLGLIGVFAQQRSYDLNYTVDDSDEIGNAIAIGANGALKNRTFFGVEGQVFLGDIEFAGQLGTQRQGVRAIIDDSSDDFKGNFGTISANYFLNNNFKLGANIGFGNFKSDLSGDIVTIKNKSSSFGVNTEYRFDSSPVSLFANYDHIKNTLSIEGNRFGESRENRLQVGVKVTFGTGSLRGQAKGGASLNPVKPVDNIPTSYVGGVYGLINTAIIGAQGPCLFGSCDP